MKQEIDNNAMWAAFRQELALQGELQVVSAIDNALNNLGFTIKETSTIIPIPLKQGEQKPTEKTTWYDNMDDLIADAMIDNIKNADMPEHCKHNRLTWINKHRSKPAEWSEEDSVMQRAALEILMASPKLVASTILKESVIVWLKFLKDRVQPQPKWRPSKEQMAALQNAIGFVGELTTRGCCLKELKAQLEKLREE